MRSLMVSALFLTSSAFATIHEGVAVSMVPHGRMIETFGRDYIIKTPAGTKIEIQFMLDGKFKEASGKNLNKGDDLEPGEGLISLSSAARLIQSIGMKPEGFWHLEKDKTHGWIYEVNGQHLVDAKKGKIIKR